MKKLLLSILTVVMSLGLAACGGESHELQIGQAYYAAHGTKAVAVATVVVEDDTIVAAYVDEFQYLGTDSTTSVPNAENLTAYVTEGYALASKKVNHEYYSTMMEAAKSTQDILDSYTAIEAYVAGKTVNELNDLVGMDAESAIDTVTGSTLADTQGYVSAILLAVEDAQASSKITYKGSLDELSLNLVYGAAHGTKCFTITAAYTDGETVVLSHIDELQYLPADSATGLPNSNEGFVAYVIDGYVLSSKRVNDELYSSLMEEAGATVNIAANYDAIQAYANGKTVSELEEASAKTSEELVDVVSGATLADTPNYLAEIIAAAK